MKVYSHQLNNDFLIASAGKSLQPNMFVVSANQIADNTAEQPRHLATFSLDWDKLFYPPFSPQWSFSFDRSRTNKGVTKLFHEKLAINAVQSKGSLSYASLCRP